MAQDRAGGSAAQHVEVVDAVAAASMPWTTVSSLAPACAPAEPPRRTSSSVAAWMPSRSARVAGSSSPALATAWWSSKQTWSWSRVGWSWLTIEKVPSCAGPMDV